MESFWNKKEKEADKAEVSHTEASKSHRRRCEVLSLSLNYEMRRGFSEKNLLDAIDKDFTYEENKCFLFITGGDVDQLSYLQVMLRMEAMLESVTLSTWCMAGEDIYQLRKWVENGNIKELKILVGEIYPSSYKVEWHMLQQLCREQKCVSVKCFRNHSKVICGKFKDKYFTVLTSANVNTNPRTENGSLIFSKECYNFYTEYFNGINSIA